MRSMQLFQSFPGNVGIDLGCRYVAVTKQHLDHSEIRSVIEQMRGECMAQYMR